MRAPSCASKNRKAPPIVRIAEYLANSARPAQAPAPHQYNHVAGRFPGNARIRHSAAPVKAQSSGPSGKTQVPLVIPKTGDRFSVTAAQKPALGPPTASPRRAISQVVNANNKMNGNRTTTGASEPVRWEAANESHQAAGGWSK